ncbi:hypothetical protein V1511DRAFT_459312 [Dipodascopsis uninucleata]
MIQEPEPGSEPELESEIESVSEIESEPESENSFRVHSNSYDKFSTTVNTSEAVTPPVVEAVTTTALTGTADTTSTATVLDTSSSTSIISNRRPSTADANTGTSLKSEFLSGNLTAHQRSQSLATSVATEASAFSFTNTAEDESKISWAQPSKENAYGHRSNLSIEYVDEYSDNEAESNQDEEKLDRVLEESSPGSVTTSQFSTPTIATTRNDESSPPENSSVKNAQAEFPKRVQSFFPAAGLGVIGIETEKFSTPGISRESISTVSSSDVCGPATSISSPQTSRASTANTNQYPSAPTSSGTNYENIPILRTNDKLLITPSNLPTVAVFTVTTRVRNLNKVKGKTEDPLIVLSITDRGSGKEWWKVTKSFNSLSILDSVIRPDLKDYSLPKLPERSLFLSFVPSKANQRNRALNDYFHAIMSIPALPNNPAIALCEFLSIDIIDPMAANDSNIRKQGYLTKRGKNFGGWKMRYFVLDSPELVYFDVPGGSQLGIIKLDQSEVLKPEEDDSVDNAESNDNYLYAFIVYERKKLESSTYTRHILCAENDQDREDWMEAIREFSGLVSDQRSVASSTTTSTTNYSSTITPSASTQTVAASLTSSGATISSPVGKKKLPAALTLSSPVTRRSRVGESGSTVGLGEYQDSEKSSSPTDVPPSPPMSSTSSYFSRLLIPSGTSSDEIQTNQLEKENGKKQKKRSFFSSKKETSSGEASPSPSVIMFSSTFAQMNPADQELIKQQHQMEQRKFLQLDNESLKQNPLYEYRASIGKPFNVEDTLVLSDDVQLKCDNDPKYNGDMKYGGIKTLNSNNNVHVPVFGLSLSQAIEVSYIQRGQVRIPSVVYRCIEYLDEKQAAREEGIFRLNGSSTVIKVLKERFNNEADVNLLDDGTHYDVHAIAGLLKLYLRELPNNILTNELQRDFLRILEIENRQDLIEMLYILVRQLPPENYSLIKALCRYLIKIVEKSNLNKMNLRNAVSIVFAPTLNIASGLVQLFISDYVNIFIDRQL